MMGGPRGGEKGIIKGGVNNRKLFGVRTGWNGLGVAYEQGWGGGGVGNGVKCGGGGRTK